MVIFYWKTENRRTFLLAGWKMLENNESVLGQWAGHLRQEAGGDINEMKMVSIITPSAHLTSKNLHMKSQRASHDCGSWMKRYIPQALLARGKALSPSII
jgi:hypothetical protein